MLKQSQLAYEEGFILKKKKAQSKTPCLLKRVKETLRQGLFFQFKPGKQRGKPVKVRVMIPIRFKLK